EVWAYCLMPNHFHFLIRIKDEASFPDETPVNKFLEVQFKRLFSSYTLSVNKVYDRSGSLFRKRFKRTLVDSQEYLTTLIHYIHHNPIHHHFTDDFKCWHYSSYSAIIGNGLTKVEREKVMELFGGRDRFIRFHSGLKEYKKIKPLLIE
ncbi:MAG TPA: transposase, partial [Balneolaceae bacterium]|nr:transposase [Balneolaceae bacterium]